MVLSHAPSTTASNVGSDLALSDANGSTDHARWGESPAFPAVWRPRPENTTTVLPNDDISSIVNTSNKDVLPPPQEKKSDALAPRPETRRLGYFSVAALIINRMIGTGIFSTPSSVLSGTGGSKGAALFLWVLGSIATIAG
ncbi:hypothetical protein MMC31_005631, partial [Peltigera leucophlebia]|nr:hypothetical protein [Peltigera leucophlebia]